MNFVFLLGGIFLAFYLGMIVALGFRLESGNFEKKVFRKRNKGEHAAPRGPGTAKGENKRIKIENKWPDQHTVFVSVQSLWLLSSTSSSSFFSLTFFCFVAIFCLLLTDAVSNSDHYGLWKNGTL